jgi:hypothetical protein
MLYLEIETFRNSFIVHLQTIKYWRRGERLGWLCKSPYSGSDPTMPLKPSKET